MTVKEKIMALVHNDYDMEVDNWEKLVIMAYYIGRESSAREVSDRYRTLIAQQRQRAQECRYTHMANKIIGDEDYIYHSDYAGEMTVAFGNDKTEL